ncbi:MAG: hypothetical protein ACYS0K_07820 [Planctomycetota bacterium]|jgi:hypothetical protein
MRWLVLAALLSGLLLGCDAGGSKPPPDDGTEQSGGATGGGGITTPSPPPPPPTTTTQPTVPLGATPPVGLTWHVGITENVPIAAMQNLYATFVAANNAIWSITEGQVRVDKIRFFDNVGPSVTVQNFMFMPFDTSNLDIVVWPAPMWDVPAGGAVGEQGGRTGRVMIIPDNVSTFVLTHEAGHLLFRLSWPVGSLLVDEYADGVQDQACVMESESLPKRLCSDRNHANQSSQPHACWRQILLDYPSFTHGGSDTAPNLPPPPVAEYNDTP